MAFFSCRERSRNQTSPLPSLSGKYVLTVPVVREERGGFESFWKVTISDSEGKLLYTDEEGFPARFNVYWVWDEDDRVWLYNSDDGNIFYWEFQDKWVKNEYDEHNSPLKIPPLLLDIQ